jgi:glycosyltransferase involved in cell wall biosynthesis
MRVLMISKALVAGTSQRKLEELAKCPDVELTLVTPAYWRSDDGSKQQLERLYTTGYRMIVTPLAFNGHFHLHYYPRLSSIMREVRPEVVHIDEEPYNFATFQAMRLAHQYKAQALFFAFQNLYRVYPPPFRQIELYNYRHAATAIAGNQDAADVLRQKGYRGSIHIIRQFGIDPQIYRRDEPRPARDPEAPFILGYVGRLVEQKGLPTLIEALSLLPEQCRIVLVGYGPMRNTLEEQAQRLGVADRVVFKGGVPTYQVPQEMQAMDALVLPSLSRPNWTEQFGRVLIEAMACETPVIGSGSGEIPIVIADAGLVFPEGNAQALAACVQQLLDDPALATQLAQKGRQRVLDNYTQEQIAKQTYTVYQEILTNSRSAVSSGSS